MIVSFLLLAAFSVGLLSGGFFCYWLGRLEELRKWAPMMPHVWMFGNDHCQHCGKTMAECGIQSVNAGTWQVLNHE